MKELLEWIEYIEYARHEKKVKLICAVDFWQYTDSTGKVIL